MRPCRLPCVPTSRMHSSSWWRSIFRATFCLHHVPSSRLASGVVLPASMFDTILAYRTQGSCVYDGLPLARMSCKQRGEVLARIVRRMDAEMHREQNIRDPSVSSCFNGYRRGSNNHEYDWIRGNSRVECKSARMMYAKGIGTWFFRFLNVKLPFGSVRLKPAFDELLLALYSPRGIYVYRHDLRLGVTSQGKQTGPNGHAIVLGGGKGNAEWSNALDSMLNKLDVTCDRLDFLALNDPAVDDVAKNFECCMTTNAYEFVPLAHVSGKLRGDLLEELVRAVDALVHPGAHFESAPAVICVNGTATGLNQTPYDYVRNGRRIECKSSLLWWDRRRCRWRIQFQNIKVALEGIRAQPLFDELLLALCTPRGVYVYRHGSSGVGFSTRGLQTAVSGHSLTYLGPANEMAWDVALDDILRRLDSSGGQRIALVEW